jgi:hypothetical protein
MLTPAGKRLTSASTMALIEVIISLSRPPPWGSVKQVDAEAQSVFDVVDLRQTWRQ